MRAGKTNRGTPLGEISEGNRAGAVGSVFLLAACAPVPCCFFVSDGIVMDGQREATETNAGVFDCDECALL